MEKKFIPANVSVLNELKFSVITLSNEIKKVYLYPDHVVKKFQDGIELTKEDWSNIRLGGELEYSAQRWNRVLQTWKELNNNVLYKHFEHNGKNIAKWCMHLQNLYTVCDANRQQQYLEFRDAIDAYTQKLIAGVGKHNATVKQKAKDDLWAINFQKAEEAKYSTLCCNRDKYKVLDESVKDSWLELAADYGVVPQTHTYYSKQWSELRDAGISDEPLGISDPHQFKVYHKAEDSDPLIEVNAKYKKEFVSETEKDLVLECMRWFRTHGDTEWLMTTQLADGRVFTNRTLRLFGVPEDSCGCEEDITEHTRFYQGDEADHYTMEFRDFLEPLHEDTDVDNNFQQLVEDDVCVTEDEDEDDMDE